jgi:hypothetical protein
MPEMLGGDLARVPLPDVLRLLISGCQTGRLDLSDGVSTGAVYLESGNLVHAVNGARVGENAVFFLMTWQEGSFSFVPNQSAPEASISTPTEQLLEEGSRMAAKWAEIMRVIPGMDAVFGLSPAGSASAISLEPQEWQVLAHVDGVRDVAEIAEALGRDELDVATVLVRLVTGGLLECKQARERDLKATINSVFLGRLDAEFLDVVGPLGPAIIDDEMANMGETRESFPVVRVAELIERISADIDDEIKRTRFQRAILDLLRSL